MSDALKRLTPGEKLGTGEGPFNAAFHNSAVDAILDNQRRSAPLGVRAGVQSDRDDSVFVANYAGTALNQFGIVGLGAMLSHPNADDGEDTWPEQTLHKTASPAAASPFGILLEPLANDTANIAPIITSGPAKCKVSLTDTAHTYAAPGAANYTHLVSQSTQGPAKITWRQGSVGTQLNGAIDDTQLTGDVDSGDDFPDVPFVITIGTEDLTVTAVSDDGLTWTWTRGANSTTPASHADNAAVAFKSGTVWASVLLLGPPPDLTISTNPATSTATGPAFTFYVSNSGTDFAITAVNGTGNVYFALPSSASVGWDAMTVDVRGVLDPSTAMQGIPGTKQFRECIILGNSEDNAIGASSYCVNGIGFAQATNLTTLWGAIWAEDLSGEVSLCFAAGGVLNSSSGWTKIDTAASAIGMRLVLDNALYLNSSTFTVNGIVAAQRFTGSGAFLTDVPAAAYTPTTAGDWP